MKVKVKGLVFAGFAAAVFAQSAMATTPTAGDLKTVTSKAYVDSKFDFTNGQVIMQGDGRGVTAAKDVVTVGSGDNNQMTVANGAALPTVSAVTAYVDNAINGVTGNSASTYQEKSATGTTPQVGYNGGWNTLDGDSSYVTVASANNTTTVALDSNKIDTDGTAVMSGTTNTNNGNLVTAGAVKAAMSDAVSSTSTGTTIATSKAVYDYAQDKSKFSAATTTTEGQSTVYTSSISTDIAGTNAGNDVYPSSRSVYEFVTGAIATSNNTAAGAYQAKVASTDANKVMVGVYYNGASTWQELADGTYVDATTSNGSTSIDIASSKLGTAAADVESGGDKLMTGGGVYLYMNDKTVAATETSGTVTASNGFTTASNTAFPTVANVKQYVAEQLASSLHGVEIPAMSSDCTTAIAQNNGSYCALVAGYDATDEVKLEWTVMAAPAANNG